MMKRLLLVDDEKWVRAALKWTVENSGLPFAVAGECANGLEALDWLRSNPVDLVLTDITMPVMNGLDFLRELRGSGSHIPVVIITVNEEFSYVQQALRSGAVDYLLKPIGKEPLRECLLKWLEKEEIETKEQTLVSAELPVRSFSLMEQVMQYFSSLPPGQITLGHTAQYLHINPSYLSQLFKQQQGVNFMDYVIALRMKEARKLLSLTTLRVSEIAERLGYNDLAYFTNMFKKITGTTPSSYRKDLWQRRQKTMQ